MSDLVTVPTLEEADAELSRYLPAGFPLSNEDAFSTFYTWKKLTAQGHVDVRAFIRDLYPQGFAMTATGAWLDLHAADHNLHRIAAKRTEGLVDFTVEEACEIPAGTVVQTPTDAAGRTYRFIAPVTAQCTPPVTRVLFRAESPGADFNVGGGRITTLVTVIDEVLSIRNNAPWIVVSGIDQEDDETLRRRIQLTWPEQGSGSTYHAYEKWARDVEGVVKVAVLDEHPRGQGTVDVVIAPSLGLPSPTLIRQVQEVVTARRPITSDALVRAPILASIKLSVTLHIRGTDTDGQAVWESRAKAVMERLDIGQTFYPSTISDELHDFPNVTGVEIVVPSSPVVVPGNTLIQPSQVTVSVVEK